MVEMQYRAQSDNGTLTKGRTISKTKCNANKKYRPCFESVECQIQRKFRRIEGYSCSSSPSNIDGKCWIQGCRASILEYQVS